MFKKYTNKQRIARGLGIFAMFPLEMWLWGIAIHAFTGRDITRWESFAIAWLVGMLCNQVGRSVRYELVSVA